MQARGPASSPDNSGAVLRIAPAASVSDAGALVGEADKQLRRALVAIDDLLVYETGEDGTWSSTEMPKIVRRLAKALTNARRALAAARGELG